MKNNGTWNAIFNGAYSANLSGTGWNIHLNNLNGDYVDINNIQFYVPYNDPQEIYKYVGTADFVGGANGPAIDRTLTLTEVVVEANTQTHHLVVDAKGTYEPL